LQRRQTDYLIENRYAFHSGKGCEVEGKWGCGKDMIKFLSMIVLLALLGCAGNKPVPEQKSNAVDDPRCEKYYKTMNENTPMGEFDFFKEEAKELLGLNINEPVDIYEISNFKELESHFLLQCNEAITCNQKSYCVSILSLKTNKIFPLF